ncbi:putative secreted protein [Actinacidiphila reveromycinica]|uniref:Putative secreted protein n=1 Tax=Actinacidiphila reveromycinica TaxID=659352 RepID=A0A7U3UMM4_9ACTN|nr:ADP-ribosyltransferase [Streptomyces sp. SN-593]BBA95361.1 putative secreted protein [Streptomyces sp. SN-593]
MIMNRVRSLAAAGVLTLTAVLATQTPSGAATAATAAAAAPSAAPEAPAAAMCPAVHDPLYAAADRSVDVERIVPDPPTYRTTCGELYRADGRAPAVVFHDGFQPKAPQDGQYDLAAYVEVNQPSPFVSTSYDHDLYKQWKSAYNYYVDAPGGIDVNATIGDTHKWAGQHEVAFAGGIDRRFVVGACPVDKATKSEVLADCVRNPFYVPWRLVPAPEPVGPALAPAS